MLVDATELSGFAGPTGTPVRPLNSTLLTRPEVVSPFAIASGSLGILGCVVVAGVKSGDVAASILERGAGVMVLVSFVFPGESMCLVKASFDCRFGLVHVIFLY